PLVGQTVAILGYGNQGRAHALNLRDSGVSVLVGARSGGQAEKVASDDGFEVLSLAEAAKGAGVGVVVLSDTEVSGIYGRILEHLKGKTIGFAHGFSYHFKQIERLDSCGYFLVGPKGAGAILRQRYVHGRGLPGVYAVAEPIREQTRELARA